MTEKQTLKTQKRIPEINPFYSIISTPELPSLPIVKNWLIF